MTKKPYTKEQLDKDIEMVEDLRYRLSNIVYAPQEGQEDHFDRLMKSEQLALYGIYHDVAILYQSLYHYKDYFED